MKMLYQQNLDFKILSLLSFRLKIFVEYAIDNFSCTLASVPNFFKTKKLCENAVTEEPFTIKFVPDCYKTQNKCEKEVDEYHFTF